MSIVLDNIQDVKMQNTSLALGFFDGFHKGHQKVLFSAIDLAKKLGAKSCVVTFKNHPIEVLYSIKPEFITTYEERINILEKMGFDIIIMADFTKEIAKLNANDYYEKVLKKLNPKSISIGYNHKFGANQSGDRYFLENLSKKYDFILDVANPEKNKNEIISSTFIRNSIKNGDINLANKLLSQAYCIENMVIHGAKRGRQINFPTANLNFPEKKIIPMLGVYAGFASINNKKLPAIANVGLRPTFGDIVQPLLEVHIVNFDEDIYGKNIKFEFLELIRPEMKFASHNALKAQISKDIAKAKKLL